MRASTLALSAKTVFMEWDVGLTWVEQIIKCRKDLYKHPLIYFMA